MRVLRLIATGLLGMVFLWAGYCAWFYLGDNARLALRPVHVPAMAWHVIRGEGRAESGNFVLNQTGGGGEILLFAPLSVTLPGDAVDRVEVRFRQVGTFHAFAIGLSQSGELSGVRQSAVNWIDDTAAMVEERDLWLDSRPISHLTLSIRSGLDRRSVIESVVIHRQIPNFGELQSLLFRSLTDFSPWTQQSINSSQPRYVPLTVSPVLAVVCWILLAGIGLLGWNFLRHRSMGSHVLAPLIIMILIGTFVLDVRWQVSLWNRHMNAVRNYSVVEDEGSERHVGYDGIYSFMEDVKRELKDNTRRMVIFADSNFGYTRARYFAIPHPAVGRKDVQPAWLYRAGPGDVIVGIGTNLRLHTKPLGVEGDRDTPVRAGEWPLQVIQGLEDAWAARSAWLHAEGTGVAELELRLVSEGGTGWVTVLIERSRSASVRQWTRRDVFIDGKTERTVTLPFPVHQGAQYRVKLHAASALQARVAHSRLRPFRYNEKLEMVSVGDGSPHVIARRLVESSGHAAWGVQ